MAFIRWVKSLWPFGSSSAQAAEVTSGTWNPAWSEPLKAAIKDKLDVLSSASDILTLRADYGYLTADQQVLVWHEFFKVLAYHESGCNPKSQAVDVGVKSNPDTWSIGLLQLSVVDQANYGLRFGYKFDDLLQPVTNLQFGVVILANQIKKRGKIFIPNHETGDPKAYFATLRPGNRYSKVEKIVAASNAVVFTEPGSIQPPETAPFDTEPTWKKEAKKYDGMGENNPKLAAVLVPKWSLFGMNLGTISKNWAAWCGLSGAVILATVGLNYPKDGALALNWDKFDAVTINYKVDGAPEGAFARLNHYGDCKREDGNHLTNFEGDCSPEDLNKPGATFSGRGGNQNDTWKVSTYAVKKICRVFWPKDAKMKPRKITKSKKCTVGSDGAESTR